MLVRPAPQANFSYNPDTCNGTVVNITWDISEGSETLSHKVLVDSNLK